MWSWSWENLNKSPKISGRKKSGSTFTEKSPDASICHVQTITTKYKQHGNVQLYCSGRRWVLWPWFQSYSKYVSRAEKVSASRVNYKPHSVLSGETGQNSKLLCKACGWKTKSFHQSPTVRLMLLSTKKMYVHFGFTFNTFLHLFCLKKCDYVPSQHVAGWGTTICI